MCAAKSHVRFTPESGHKRVHLWRPLDFRPHLSVDREVISVCVNAANLDYAVASLICHFVRSLLLLPLSKRRTVEMPVAVRQVGFLKRRR